MDYSFEAIKNPIHHEANLMKEAQHRLVAPAQYGAMPDLGLYSRPDGPAPNWSELLPLGIHDVRKELGLGLIPAQDLAYPKEPAAMESKFRIAEVLELPINSVTRFRHLAGLGDVTATRG